MTGNTRYVSGARRGRRLSFASALFLDLLGPSRASAATLVDGPYVMQGTDGWIARWVEGDALAPKVREQRLAAWPTSGQASVVVPAVGAAPAFTVRLRPPDSLRDAPDEVSVPAGNELFVIADTHGEFEILVELLRKQRVIGDSLQWTFGHGHLVVLGDVFDRGPNHTEILWLLYKLEEEARRAGGGLHLLIGNHETLVMLGAREYLHPKYLLTARALDEPSYATLWDQRSLLGRWLRTKATVQKLGDVLCLHGGISPQVMEREYTLREINVAIRESLRHTPPYLGARPRFDPGELQLLHTRSPPASQLERERAAFLLLHPLGPLWYRGYFPQATREGFPVADDASVVRMLGNFGVRAILVGHTQVPTVTPLFGGKVIAVQVYPRRSASGEPTMEGLLIRNGKFLRARIDGALESILTDR